MSWKECHVCGREEGYSDENPFVHLCVRHPSDPSEMTCAMVGHYKCYRTDVPASFLPDINESGGIATPKQWSDWIESSEAAEMGFCFLT